MKFSVHQASRIGGRKYNQDRVGYAYTSESLLLVLADGMGGHLHGEVAAHIAVHTFMQDFEKSAHPRVEDPEKFLSETMRHAHESIVQYARNQGLGGNPGTTCVVALVQDGQMRWAHAGDSRCYLLRCGEAVAVTHDHSVVQQWADWGIISPDEMKTHPERNKITNCLGGSGDMFYPESAPAAPVQPNDVLLLCSDGMWSPLDDAELAQGFCSTDMLQTMEQLMDKAIKREGHRADNTTAIAVRLSDAEKEQHATAPVCVELSLSESVSSTELLGRTHAGDLPSLDQMG